MRRVIVATLALTPMLLHAQANSPAKTQSSATSTTLQSKLVQPEELNASAGSHGTAPVRVSTGVGAPKLIHHRRDRIGFRTRPAGFTTERKLLSR